MSAINIVAADARKTLRLLIQTHSGTLKAIEDGQKFWKDGVDITETLYHTVKMQIAQCRQVDDALDHMKNGDIKRAAALCEQIKEFIPNGF